MLQVSSDNAHLWTSSVLLKIPSVPSLFCHDGRILHSFLRHHRASSVHHPIIFIQLMLHLWTVVALMVLWWPHYTTSLSSYFNFLSIAFLLSTSISRALMTINSTSYPLLSLSDNYFDSGEAIHVPQISTCIYGGISGDHSRGNFLIISLWKFMRNEGEFSMWIFPPLFPRVSPRTFQHRSFRHISLKMSKCHKRT